MEVGNYEEFIYKSRYARWLPDKNRREEWNETVDRYLQFVKDHLKDNHNYKLEDDLFDELFTAIYNLEVMPSMRAMMTAGPALARDNTAGYNCSYLPIDDPKAFDETMHILMNGAGVGFSVERQYIQKLPEVPDELFDSDTTVIVKDSKEGWAKALRQIISLLYSGEIPQWDTSKIREAGAPLKTFGGRASGPAPLEELFEFTVHVFKGAAGRKLSSIECHDLMCKIGEIVVVGGVRRSAMISLSNLSDDRMRTAKSGQWWNTEPQRALANNSVAYTDKPEVGTFMREWLSLYDSKSGERGIFNREASKKKAAQNGQRKSDVDFGTNPCSEIILRPQEFCNLTEVVVRPDDTKASLIQKSKLASILGTFQSTLTHFPYLRKAWKRNTEEERLLGVSLTGIMDHAILNGTVKDKSVWNDFSYGENEDLSSFLSDLKDNVVGWNKIFSDELNIEQSVATTCIKPSGTVSQRVNSSSGIHSRWAPYYIRSIRADNKDPITRFMKDMGVPNEPDIMKKESTTVFYFPVKSPDGAITNDDLTAIQQLELWLVYQDYWCEHKPSVTINVKEHEWPEVGSWVYNHFDKISGVSFLPYQDHSYKQAPYQTCTEKEYNDLKSRMPENFDWSKLSEYEFEDNTASAQTLACSGPDGCEIVDLTENV